MPDWDCLRQRSIRPGGFGRERATIWPEVLNVGTSDLHSRSVEEGSSTIFEYAQPHEDERQILLDTERSFVLYPVVDMKNKDEMKARLNELIVSVFRQRPRLNYYQGYHDIISVLFLTLPENIQFSCAEKMSLHRLRDSMGHSLDPVVGLLRVLRKLISLADSSYAALLNRNVPLPYYALSNLLTLFSHDVPTLPLVQHVFDFLLVRPPIAVVYLAAAIILCRKEEVYRLEEAGEGGMFHALLTSLPELYEEAMDPLRGDEKAEIKEDSKVLAVEVIEKQWEPLEHLAAKEEPSDTQLAEKSEADPYISNDEPPLTEDPSSSIESIMDSSTQSESSVTSASYDATLVSENGSATIKNKKLDVDDIQEEFEEQVRRHRLRVSLTFLLTQADELYSRFPPSYPDLCLSSIMGPNSVVFTWSETDPASLSDSEAEEIVDKPETVALPYTDAEEPLPQKNDRRVEIRRKLRAALFGKSRLGKRTIFAGVVLVLGVVMAMYGLRAGSPLTNHRSHRHGLRKLVRWLGGLLSRG